MTNAEALIEKILPFKDFIVSDNLRAIANDQFMAMKMAKFHGNEYLDPDYITLADYVAAEMDIRGVNFPYSTSEVIEIIHEQYQSISY
jgi:hypothetical protein